MILKSINKNLKHKIFVYPKFHKLKQSPKYFFNHSILTTKYGDLNHKHPIHYLNEIKGIICKCQHKENMIKHREIG